MESVRAGRIALLKDVLSLARKAGEIILEIYATDFAVRGKSDCSPVTEADERAEATRHTYAPLVGTSVARLRRDAALEHDETQIGDALRTA